MMAHHQEGPPAPQMRCPASPHGFEIAIICALPLEADAVDSLFDYRWDDDDNEGGFPFEKAPGDSNAYTVGAIKRHYVVLAFMPGMGKASAATVAMGCRATFPNIKLGLVVGICGIVPFPSKDKEVILGDVIISEAVIQYDLGRQFPEHFVRKDTLTESLSRPNLEIRGLLAKLKSVRSRRMLQGKVAEYLSVIQEDTELEAQYPGPSHDVLFEASYRHLSDGMSCQECGCRGTLIPRQRLEQAVPPVPAVHFGLLASGDTLMKSGGQRDAIAEREGILGFEMEAAGVWDIFPCLVIKAGCDYADSHKTKIWQRYAAASAAACMKAVLSQWAPLKALGNDENAHSSMPRWGQGNTQRSRLLSILNDSIPDYQDRKDRNPKRVPGTCQWFIHHPKFKHWQTVNKSALLWVSADPGCGKSVLAKYLVDDVLSSNSCRTMCYFFFKDDFEDQKRVEGALCCILYQLFSQQPALLTDDILEELNQCGRGIFETFRGLWRILEQATSSAHVVGEIICIMDALDECEGDGRTRLLKALNKLYNNDSRDSSLKFLVTSRPYGEIQREFHSLESRQPTVRLSGENEDEAEQISQEIDVVIRARLDNLGSRLSLTTHDIELMRTEISRIDNRTYLWAHLVFANLEDDMVHFSKRDLYTHIRSMPRTVEEAYEKILSKISDMQRAKKLLHIVVGANRALSLRELAEALIIGESHRSYLGLKAELVPSNQLLRNIREACGLFVVIKDGKIYLLHQTAREFLVTPSTAPSSTTRNSPHWKNSLHPIQSHILLSEICIRYLFLIHTRWGMDEDNKVTAPFLGYAARYWADHFRRTYSRGSKEMLKKAVQLCDEAQRSPWLKIAVDMRVSLTRLRQFSALTTASYYGLAQVVEFILHNRKHVSLGDSDLDGRSALSWASENGHVPVVELLVQQVSRYMVILRGWSLLRPSIMNQKDCFGRTPLFYASMYGHVSIARILFAKGARLPGADCYRETPLTWALRNGHQEIVELLCEKGAHLKSEENILPIPIGALLVRAIWDDQVDVVKMLVDKCVDVNAEADGWAPLEAAIWNQNELIVEMLLEGGASSTRVLPSTGRTPLNEAVRHGSAATVHLLLDHGAVVDQPTQILAFERGDMTLMVRFFPTLVQD